MVVHEQAEHVGSLRIALGRPPRQLGYSHPHPQVQGASAHWPAGVQVQVQPQAQPWVLVVVSLISCSDPVQGWGPRSSRPSHLLTHALPEHYTLERSRNLGTAAAEPITRTAARDSSSETAGDGSAPGHQAPA
ncbi:MAG TPA: hypothetical protein VMY76_12970 [Gemmatimonadales bacterium]|nr:hypothetical protein [Gemmatimonadales bacterium]